MHATEREQLILQLLADRGFVGFQELEKRVAGSPATLRRDLDRLERSGAIERVRGGAKLLQSTHAIPARLTGVPFHENIARNRSQKEAIGRAAAELCQPGESIMVDGGSTTLQMCPHVAALGLHVLTNSLHIASALLPQPRTQISVPAGTVFREQNIVLSPFEDDGMSHYRASKLFMGAASIGPHGLMQTDVILVQAERRLLNRADSLIVLADSSKFDDPTGHTVCPLSAIDVIVTDDKIKPATVTKLKKADIRVVIAKP